MTGQSGQPPRRAAAVVASVEAVEIDAAYGAYDESPLDTPDEWGDLASFRAAAGES